MTPYSYHSFIFPFSWKRNGKTSVDEFVKCFEENNSKWTSTDMADPNRLSSDISAESLVEKLNLYKQYQFFHRYARYAIYGMKKNIVHNFSYKDKAIRNKGHYYIEKGGRTYDLVINAIRLKIFNTGVALFILECENHGTGCNGLDQKNVDAVKNINDYGRRVSLPFISEVKSGSKGVKPFSICADSLKIELDGKWIAVADFADFISKTNENKAINMISLTHIDDVIKKVLADGSRYKFSSREGSSVPENTFVIYPLLDDRMYVSCIVNDADYVRKILGGESEETITNYDPDYLYLKDDSLSDDLYELIFVDPKEKVSCKNHRMKQEMIDRSMYKRWLNYGNPFFVTDYSFIMLTPANDFSNILNENFLLQYYQMYCLVIAQQASLAKFKYDMVDLANEFDKDRNQFDRKLVKKIMLLQEKFVAFDSQLCFKEVSPEQQGIELYDLLKQEAMIDEERTIVKEQLNALYEAANTSLNFTTNTTVLIFTWIAAFISFASMLIASIQVELFSKNVLNGMLGLAEDDGISWILIICTIFCVGVCVKYLLEKRDN